MLRRLEKRIIVDLPTFEARKKMFQHHLPQTVIKEENGLLLCADLDYNRLAEVRFLISFHNWKKPYPNKNNLTDLNLTNLIILI